MQNYNNFIKNCGNDKVINGLLLELESQSYDQSEDHSEDHLEDQSYNYWNNESQHQSQPLTTSEPQAPIAKPLSPTAAPLISNLLQLTSKISIKEIHIIHQLIVRAVSYVVPSTALFPLVPDVPLIPVLTQVNLPVIYINTLAGASDTSITLSTTSTISAPSTTSTTSVAATPVTSATPIVAPSAAPEATPSATSIAATTTAPTQIPKNNTRTTTRNAYVTSLKFFISKGFQLCHDSTKYLTFLSSLRSLFEYYKQITALECGSPNDPSVFSLIGSFCMISYIDRYTPIVSRDPSIDQQFALIENELVQYVARFNPKSIIFPLSYIASHLMDIYLGPEEQARTLSETHSNGHQWKIWYKRTASLDGEIFFSTILCDSRKYECNINLTPSGQFTKSNPEPNHKFSYHLKYVPIIRDDTHAMLYTKCLMFLDAFTVHNRPICCTTSPHGHIGTKLATSASINWHLLALLNIKTTVQSSRLDPIMALLTTKLATCTTQNAMFDLVAQITPKTWSLLERDYVQYPGYFPITTLIYDTFAGMDVGEVETGLTWHALVPRMLNVGLVVRSWKTLLARNSAVLYRKRILETYELDRSVSHPISTLLQVLKSSDVTTDVLVYFDVLKCARDDRRGLFHVNVQTHYHLNEDGEEGAINETMDDVTAANLFFTSVITDMFPRRLTDLPVVLSNVLVSIEILDAPPVTPLHIQDLTAMFLVVWNALAVAMPPDVFQASLDQLVDFYFPDVQMRMLEVVYVAFRMMHCGRDGSLAGMVGKYKEGVSPFNAYVEYFRTGGVGKDQKGLVLLQEVSRGIVATLNLMEPVVVAEAKRGKRKRGVQSDGYEFVKGANFPRQSVEFLGDCLMACSDSVLAFYFKYLVGEMKLVKVRKGEGDKGYTSYQTLFVALLVSKKVGSEKVLDAGMLALFLKGEPAKLSSNFYSLTLAAMLVERYINDEENMARPVGSLILTGMLQTGLAGNQTSFNNIRNLNSLNSSSCFAERFLDMLVSPSHHSLFILETKSSSRFLELLDTHSSNPKIIATINSWEQYLCEPKRPLSIVLTEKYNPKLSNRLKLMIERHVVETLKRAPDAMYVLMARHLENESTFLNDLIVHCFSPSSNTDFQSTVTDAFKEGTNKILLSLTTLSISDGPKPHEKAVHHFIISCGKWLRHDAVIGLQILAPTQFAFTMSQILPKCQIKTQKAILDTLKEIYVKMKDTPKEFKDPLARQADCIWSVRVSSLVNTCTGLLEPFFYGLMHNLVDLLPKPSRLSQALIRFAAGKLVLTEQWYNLLAKCITNQKVAEECTIHIRQWVCLTTVNASLVKLFDKWRTLLDRPPERIMVSRLAHNLDNGNNAEVCGALLDVFSNLPPKCLLDHLSEIIGCLQNPIFFNKCVVLLSLCRNELVKLPFEGRGSKWFDVKTQEILFEIQVRAGFGFESVIFNVLKAIKQYS